MMSLFGQILHENCVYHNKLITNKIKLLVFYEQYFELVGPL